MDDRRPTAATLLAAIAAAAVVLIVDGADLSAGTGRPPSAQAPPAAIAAEQLEVLKAEGQVIYMRECASCHGAEGTSDGAGPPLADRPTLANRSRVIEQILFGSPDKGMEAFGKTLTDRDVAAVGTYVRNAWDNTFGAIVDVDVKPIREQRK